MPESKKRKREPKVVEEKHINPQESKAGIILIAILAISMVVGIAVAAVFLIINYL